VIDPSAFHLLLLAVTGWLDGREREAIAYLIEENRVRCGNAIRVTPHGGIRE
jgi:hypothetical protein